MERSAAPSPFDEEDRRCGRRARERRWRRHADQAAQAAAVGKVSGAPAGARRRIPARRSGLLASGLRYGLRGRNRRRPGCAKPTAMNILDVLLSSRSWTLLLDRNAEAAAAFSGGGGAAGRQVSHGPSPAPSVTTCGAVGSAHRGHADQRLYGKKKARAVRAPKCASNIAALGAACAGRHHLPAIPAEPAGAAGTVAVACRCTPIPNIDDPEPAPSPPATPMTARYSSAGNAAVRHHAESGRQHALDGLDGRLRARPRRAGLVQCVGGAKMGRPSPM